MILPDVNVLVHAFRSDAGDHTLCRKWLETVVNGPSRYGLSPQALGAVIRVTTHSKIFLRPNRLAEVISFCELLMAQPHSIIIQPGPQHWSIFTRLCQQADAREKGVKL